MKKIVGVLIVLCGMLFPVVGNAGGYIPSSADGEMAYRIEQIFLGLSTEEKQSLVEDLQEFRRTSILNESARYLVWYVETLYNSNSK